MSRQASHVQYQQFQCGQGIAMIEAAARTHLHRTRMPVPSVGLVRTGGSM